MVFFFKTKQVDISANDYAGESNSAYSTSAIPTTKYFSYAQPKSEHKDIRSSLQLKHSNESSCLSEESSIHCEVDSENLEDSGCNDCHQQVRADYLCNQHLVPEQFRKLIVPDMKKMMQMGKERAWEDSVDTSIISNSTINDNGGVCAKTDSCIVKASLGSEKSQYHPDIIHCNENQRATTSFGPFVQASDANVTTKDTTTNSYSHASHGIRITAEELFANYEAAVIGSHKSDCSKYKTETSATEFRSSGEKAPTYTEQELKFKTSSSSSSMSSPGIITTFVNPRTHTLGNRPLPNLGCVVGTDKNGGVSFDSKVTQLPIAAALKPGLRDVKQVQPQIQQPQIQPQVQHQQRLHHPHQQQMQHGSSQLNKGREQILTAASYYANARMNDVMTFATTGASINIPGLPRIPILSPQAAVQNAYLLRASGLRPCIQPNMSVPPPGFIPLMPVHTGHTFHHGPGGYPMGAYFSPGIFHSPNFIAMTPHPTAAAAFIQQAKVSICTNVNINSNISATFNLNSGNGNSSCNRNDNQNTLYAFTNNSHIMQLRATSKAKSTTTTTATAVTHSSVCGTTEAGRRQGEMKLHSKTSSSSSSSTKSGGPLMHGTLKLLSKQPKTSASKIEAPVSIMESSHNTNSGQNSKRDSLSLDLSSHGDEVRSDRGGGEIPASPARMPPEMSRVGICPGQTDGSANRPRGSNTDNLIRVFPPRT